MWKEISVDSERYLVKYARQNTTCIIHLTNLVNIWAEEVATSSLIQRCKDQNPLIEADDESLIQHLFSLLEDRKEDITFRSNLKDGDRTLELKKRLAGVPFYFTFNLKLMSPEVLFQEVTKPLLLLVRQLFTSQNTLCELLEAKDAEIAEYKVEGAQLKRRKLETQQFKRDEFIGSSVVPTSMIFSNLAIINQDTQHKENCMKSSGDVPVESENALLPPEIQEPPVDSLHVQVEMQESELNPPPSEIKEELGTQTESGNAKKRKQASKPKLRL
ncbi:non-homologous end-joining factor 1 [Anabrus simplex]|uniref:non-homologous end-joining factor 1 n=1 Tax=Anabrus simplex TaxID=316456 RepID=UPI0034DD350F